LTRALPLEAVEAMRDEHRLELAKLRMQLALYRQSLVAAGIDPPDRDGAELLQMWQDCRAVISTASHFTASLRSAKELL
jgi:hypothetical protein